MLAKIISCTSLGVEALRIDVEIDVALGLPSFATVGLPDNAVRESKERVRAAIKNCGYEYPNRKITVNMAPADVKKEGAGFDLPIAVGILSATGLLGAEPLEKVCIVGELSLDGSVRRVKGLLPMLLMAENTGVTQFIIPAENRTEAEIVASATQVIPVESLPEAIEHLSGERLIPPVQQNEFSRHALCNDDALDFSDVHGQEHVKRALEIAAAGGHNVIMTGSPGSGKTMLAKRFPSILPSMSREEIIETTMVYSVSEKESAGTLQSSRPFRAPHHTISDSGLIGGGRIPRPGEVSLAHNGVLFLDELPEYKKNVLEVLRQPLENGQVTITRSNISLSFPAKFILIAAMNPCPCGFFGDARNGCRCTPAQVHNYSSRISGPLLDRIDIQVTVSPPCFDELHDTVKGETSKKIRDRVEHARLIQDRRFDHWRGMRCNALMNVTDIEDYCVIDSLSEKLLRKAMRSLHLSARGYHRVLRLARTIADLEASQEISSKHIAEAIQFRRSHQ